MPRNKSGSANGGLIGKRNLSSFGKCTQTAKTSSGDVTTQPGTRVVQTLIVAGGGGGARSSGGGGGAGGLRNIEVPVSGNTAVPVTIGAGGSGGCQPSGSASHGNDSNIVGNDTTHTSECGG